MFNIFSHKGNANQNYTEIPSCPSQNGCHQENKCKVRIWGKRSLYILLVGMEISAAIMAISMEVPQKTKTELPYDPAIALLGIYPKS
jgi:hypothetical protein